jgi:hypothetical protein
MAQSPRRASLLAALLAGAACSHAASSSPPPAGRATAIYVYAPPDWLPDGVSRTGANLATSLSQMTDAFPAIDEMSGIILMIAWNQLCPASPDSCDFTLVDAVLDYWHARGKKVILNVATVGYPYAAWVNGAPVYLNETPQWVLDRLAPDAAHPVGGTYPGTPTLTIGKIPAAPIPAMTYPAYWDDRFVQLSSDLASQLAARYDSHPALQAVRIGYGLQGEENPTIFGAQVALYPAGFTFQSWLTYVRQITDIYLAAFATTTLETDISYTPWIRNYAAGHADPASVAAADAFVAYLMAHADRISIGYNGFEDTSCLTLPAVACPSATTADLTPARLAIETAAMGYVAQVKAAGQRFSLEGGPLLNPDMSGPDLDAALVALVPDRYDLWGGDAASLDYERNGFTVTPQNQATMKWYGDAVARRCATEGEDVLRALSSP